MAWGYFLTEHATSLITLAVLLLVSGLLSGSESALFSLSHGQLHRLRQGGRASRLVAALMRRPVDVLNTILLGNMFVNTAFAAISAVLVLDADRQGLSAWGAALVSFVPLVLLISLGELTPKMIGFAIREKWSVAAGGVLTVLTRIFRPVLRAIDVVLVAPLAAVLSPRTPLGAEITAPELSEVLSLSVRRGLIGHDTNLLLQEILELTDLRAGDVMVPRVDMVAYDVDGSPEGLRELFRRTHLRRIPVYKGDLDNIVGIVYAKKLLLNPQARLPELVVKPLFVPEAAKLERVLIQFRVTRTQMAIVVDEFGGTAGLISLREILEEIVGELPAGYEPGGGVVEKINEREYLLSGDLAFHEWADAFRVDVSGKRITTVGGFVTSLLGRIPKVDDQAVFRNLRFTVVAMRKRRIERLHLELREGKP